MYCSVNINHSLRGLGYADKNVDTLGYLPRVFSSEALSYETDPDKGKSVKVESDLAVKPTLTFVIHSVLCCKF